MSRAPETADGHTPSQTPAGPERVGRGVTLRAVLLAAVLLVAFAPCSFYIEQLVQVSWGFSGMVPPILALGVLFFLALLNHLRRGPKLSRRELLVVYVLLTVGAPLVSRGVMLWFLACSLGPQYYVVNMPQWETTFFRYIPPWFYPNSYAAVDDFFQGHARVPWSFWWTPLLAWGLFFVALFTASLCLFLLMRRQWVTHERLSFPIAQVPLELVRDRGQGIAGLPASTMFWIGMGTVTFLGLQAHLPAFFPSMPSIPLGEYQLMPADKVGPLVGMGDLWIVLYPWCIALAYLLPKEISFSVWFFWFVRVACTVTAIAAGATPRKPEDWSGAVFPAPYLQGGGAVIALGLLTFWAGRRHLLHALRAALTGTKDGEDTLAYRWIVLGLLLSVGYLVCFCWGAGSRLLFSFVLIGLILAYHLVWGRLRAENGMSFIGFPFSVQDMITGPAGTALYRPAELITLVSTRWSYFPGWGESCEVITGASLDALKIADAARIRQKPLLLVMLGTFVFALVLGIFVELNFAYHYGFLHILPQEGWLESLTKNTGTELYEAMTAPSRLDLPTVAGLGAGMGMTFLMAAMRLRFWWWPLHPIGYIAANVWGSQWWWMPLFVGWLLKSLTVRYGGLRLYQRFVPMAIGIIVGDRAGEVVWAFIMWFVRTHQ